MSTRSVHRPARTIRPPEQPEPRTLAAPPTLGESPNGLPLQSLLPVIGALSSITMMTVLRSNPLMVVVGAVILVVALIGGLGMAFSSRGRQARARREQRQNYLNYLDTVREEYREKRADALSRSQVAAPAPAMLSQIIAQSSRIWERRPGDPDFCALRAGTASVPWFELRLPEDPNPVQPFDPIMVAEARSAAEALTETPGMPVQLGAGPGEVISIVGETADTRGVARALISHFAALHAPDEAQFAAALDHRATREWAGMELLPHLENPGSWDGPLPARRTAFTAQELNVVLSDELSTRARRALRRSPGDTVVPLLVLLDHTDAPISSPPLPAGSNLRESGISVIALVADRSHEPGNTTIRVTVEPGTTDGTVEWLPRGDRAARTASSVRFDTVAPELFGAICGSLAPMRLSATSRTRTAGPSRLDALDLLGVDSIDGLGPRRWNVGRGDAFLRTAVGTTESGTPVLLDLKEAAQGGMGPHGVCIGATGSGKSEFLRTLVLGLAAAHGPEDLSMILVDYKGGAAFSPFHSLPQVAGVIDNLEGEAGLIERARTSISGEIVRRQQQLKAAGSLSSITEYRLAREAQPFLPPMPHLLLVLDEFGELLTAEPDFIEMLLQIGRIGRSIGVHMLLSSQRIEAGKLRGLDTFLSYRIGLRTFSEQESHTVLGTPDAYRLPSAPGGGYLKVDSSVYTRFQSGFVSGPVPGPAASTREEAIAPFVVPFDNSIEEQLSGRLGHISTAQQGGGKAVLIDEAVKLLRAGIEPTPPVWLPPLPDRLPLLSAHTGERTDLSFPIGLLDDPAKQFQGPWLLDLARAGGHHAVIGSPQSGRSTYLRTVAAGIATTLPPTRVSVYGLDLTGSGLNRIIGFPHVGGVATRGDTERQTRLLEEIESMLRAREALFRDHRIESLAHFRALHRDGRLPGVVASDIVLLIDGMGLVRTEFTAIEATLADLLTRGSGFGIHLVFSLTRWAELPMRLQPLVGNRVELRLNDPGESTIGRKLAATVDQPGRALTEDKLFAQVALPTADQVPDEEVGEALAALASQTSESWTGPAAAPVRLLPERLPASELARAAAEPGTIPIGLRQDTMGACALDLGGRDQHLLVLGDAESGKSNLLALLIDGIVARHTPEQAVIALMEPRGALAGRTPDEYLGGHAADGQRARELAAALALELEKRRSGESSADLRIFALVDDFDILAAGGTAPLQPLLPYLPQARDLGLTVCISRPVAGSARALYESTLQTLRDLGATGLLLSGERSEGQLWPGVTASPAIPGRARIIRRGEPPRQIQVAIADSTAGAPTL